MPKQPTKFEVSYYDEYHDSLTQHAREYEAETPADRCDNSVFLVARLQADLQVQRRINRALREVLNAKD